SDCTESYSVAGEETFKAEPDPGYKYTGWNQGHCAGVGDCYVSWDANQATNFEGESRYTIEASFEPVNPTPQSVSYTYNALGQRVAKTANGITTFYVYDQYGNLISEVDQNGTILREYVYFEGQRVAHIEA